MDKVSLLSQIKTSLEGLLSQTRKLESGKHTLHQIDKDLLLEKTRALYEQMMALENIPPEEKAPVAEPRQVTAAPATEETAEEVVVEVPEKESQDTSEPKVEKEVQEEKFADSSKTTLDLFSEAPAETLGDSLTPSEKPAVADSLQISGISDLREAIGINDKFLFINELFNGDLERYNKVIDELNGFSGFLGAQTYLTELQVQYQWEENGQAYQKLNNLLERKFA
jgi:hypothetical protein